MPDYGAKVADAAIRDVDRKLRTVYGTAQKELKEKLKDFNQRYAEKDKIKRKQLADGKISRQDYADWKAGQIFQQKQWKSKVDEASKVMLHHNEQAAKIVNEGRLDVFAENYNFNAFIGEQVTGLSFGVYNTQAVARLIKDDPQVLPEWKIDEEKDYEWNYKKVNNIINQGIIQGESIPQMTERLCKDLCAQDESKMRMFARTAITGAQNAGRQEQMEDAADMGIEVHKQWLATMDSRTRDTHRGADGQEVPYNELFEVGGEELDYPGDPMGEPAEVYNCRCTMVTIYPKYEDRSARGVRRAYAEWTDEDGTEHRQSYLTVDPAVYYKWKDEKTKDITEGDFLSDYESDLTFSEFWSKLLSRESENTSAEKDKTSERKPRRKTKLARLLQREGVESVELKKREEELSNSGIIKRIGGEDKEGSCVPLAFCYIAQKYGYDARDFRGGKSTAYIAAGDRRFLREVNRKAGGKILLEEKAESSTMAGINILKNAKDGKEYLFACGRHVAIVRYKQSNDTYEYLSLQNEKGNEWKVAGERSKDRWLEGTLESRFGTYKAHRNEALLMDIDDLAKRQEFWDIMDFINTK